jgi:hypothetical protein
MSIYTIWFYNKSKYIFLINRSIAPLIHKVIESNQSVVAFFFDSAKNENLFC